MFLMFSGRMAASPGRRTPDRRRILMAGTALGALVCTGGAMAQQQPAGKPVELPVLGVEDTARPAYKPEEAASPKYTAPLRDLPQTVTVIPSQVIRDQNLLTLREVLTTVPGITFGAGEGGGGYGDSVNLRGFSANSDITVDGVRDSAQYSRTDPFNLEQVEIVNGANSVYSGAGSVGGTINLVTKTPYAGNSTTATAGVGTDAYWRGTVDANQELTDGIGGRLNAMWHRNDVAGRDVERFKRWGIAPSVAFGLKGDTKVTLAYVHQHDNNTPQYGVPYFMNAFNNGPLPGVNSNDYFGYDNIDTQQIDVDSVTAILEHRFNDALSLRDLARFQQVSQLSIVDPPQGIWCLANGINVATGAACASPGFYTPSGPRGNLRDTVNRLMYNQADLNATFNTGSLSHTLVFGVSVSHETFDLDTGNILRNPGGALPNPALPNMAIGNPNHVYAGPVNYVRTSQQDASLDGQAVYLFDTIKLPANFELTGGLRFEHSEGKHTTATFTNGAFASQGPVFSNSDNLFSYRFGLVYKPVTPASLYVAYGNSKSPSKSSVNGACNATSCGVKPETAVNYEIGAKWDVLGEQLSLTAALFRNERTNYRVPSGDPIVPEMQVDGRSRVDGIAAGASGQITEAWSVFANYTYLDSEVLQSISDLQKRAGVVDPQKGNKLTNVPDHSFSLWTTYTLPMGVQLGYGATYQGRWTFNNAAPPHFKTPGYWTHKLLVAYAVTEQLNLQVNVDNLFDKKFYARIRNNGWATPGDGRRATITASYTF